MPHNSLSLVVLSNNAERFERLAAWAESKSYFDELHLFVDQASKDMDKLFDRARAGFWMISTAEVTVIDAALSFCHSPEHIKTNWLLHLGDDELMGKWFDEDVERLLAGPYDVYTLPRYNLVHAPYSRPTEGPGEGYIYDLREPRYISSDPWYPDWATRLFRPGYVIHNGKIHEGPVPRGRIAMARPHVFHFDFIDQTREERERKWKQYLKQGVAAVSSERGLADDYYKRWCLPEEFEHEVAVCEEPL